MPVIEAISLKGISLVNAGNETKTIILDGSQNTLTLSGSCLPTIKDIWIQHPLTQAWTPVSQLANTGADLDCSDNSFSFTVPTDSGVFSYDRNTSFTKNLIIRGTTKELVAASYSFELVYSGQAPPSIQFSTVDFSIVEGGTGTPLRISLSRPHSVDVTFSLGLSGASYALDYSFTPNNFNLTIPAGQTYIDIILDTVNDSDVESNEVIIISLTNITNAIAATTNQVLNITILDNDFGAFSVSGIAGTFDSQVDGYLVDGVEPKVVWTSSTTAAEYRVVIYESNATTVKCAEVIVTAPATSLQFSASCSLTAGANYYAAVSPSKNSFSGAASLLLFRVNSTPVLQNNLFYAFTGETSIVIPLTSIFTDPDGDTLSVNSISASSEASNGVVNNGTSIELTPSGGYYGLSTLTLTVADSLGSTSSTTVTFKHVGEYTWTGDTGSSNWSTAANWCGSLNAARYCAGHTVPPSSGSIVRIDQTCSANCGVTLSSSISANTLLMNGPVTLSQGSYPISIGAGGVNLKNASTFLGGSANINVTGNTSVDGISTFRSTSATANFYSNFKIVTGSTFQHNNGTVNFEGLNGSIPETIDFQDAVTLNNLKFAKSAAIGSTVKGNITVAGTATFQALLSNASTAQFFAKGDVYFSSGGVNSNLGGTNLTISGAGNTQSLAFTDPNHLIGSLTLDKPTGNINFLSYGANINIARNFTHVASPVVNYDTAGQYFSFTTDVADSIIDSGTFEFPTLLLSKSGTSNVLINNTVRTKSLNLYHTSNFTEIRKNVGDGVIEVLNTIYSGSTYTLKGNAIARLPDSATSQNIYITNNSMLALEVMNTLATVSFDGDAVLPTLKVGTGAVLEIDGYNVSIPTPAGLTMDAGSEIAMGGGTLTVNGANVPLGNYGGGQITP